MHHHQAQCPSVTMMAGDLLSEDNTEANEWRHKQADNNDNMEKEIASAQVMDCMGFV